MDADGKQRGLSVYIRVYLWPILCFRNLQVDSRMLKAMRKLASFRQKNLSASEAVVLRRDLGDSPEIGFVFEKSYPQSAGHPLGSVKWGQTSRPTLGGPGGPPHRNASAFAES
jgi:hypothetical protein